MSIQLTAHQLHELDVEPGRPQRVVDPRTKTTYVLIREQDYEAMREILEDEQRQEALHSVALRNAAVRLDEAP
jgi:hypothetical protein